MNATIRIRRDTAANWTAVNPVLASGEPGLETDTRKIKYGDGATAWSSLAYSYTGGGGGGGSGDVSGPGASTDNAMVRWDGTTGELVQNSTATLSDAGLLTATGVTVTNLTVSGTLSLPAGAVTLTMLSSAVQTSLGKADTAVQPASLSSYVTITGAETLTNKTLTSPVLTTPALGTPASGTLTNCTGLPTAGLVNGAVTMVKLNQAGATAGQIIMWNGTAWAPSSAYVDNAGLSTTLEAYVTSTALTSTLSDYVTDTELTNALSAYVLPQLGATSGQVLTWDGTAWAPATPASGGAVAWNDITGKPSTFTPADHNQAASTISDSTSAGRALLTAADVAAQRTALALGGAAVLNVGTSSGTVAAGDHAHSGVYADASHTHAPSALTAGGATSGQVLTWDGTAWAPATPAAGTPADNSIAAAKLAATGQYKIFGRYGTGAGAGQEMSLDAVFTVDGSGVISLTENYATAADVTAATWVRAARTTDSLPRSANTTLAADGVLKIPLAANQKVCFRASVFFVTNGTADFKWGHTSPSGHTAYYLSREGVAGGGSALTGILVDTAPNTSGIAMLGSGAAGHIWFEGTVTNGSTAGDWDFTWAQNTSTVFDTLVLAGSYVEYFIC